MATERRLERTGGENDITAPWCLLFAIAYRMLGTVAAENAVPEAACGGKPPLPKARASPRPGYGADGM